jgi:hypothetical protein
MPSTVSVGLMFLIGQSACGTSSGVDVRYRRRRQLRVVGIEKAREKQLADVGTARDRTRRRFSGEHAALP